MISTSSIEPGLASLITPLTPDDFFDRHWRREHLHVRGGSERLLTLTTKLHDFDHERVFRATGYYPIVWIADPDRGAPIRMQESTEKALTLYRLGATISIEKLPALVPWAAAIATELGVPLTEVVCNVVASRKGRGTSWQFVASEMFVVQLRGTQEWTLAKNDSVQSPIGGHVAGDALTAEMVAQAGPDVAAPRTPAEPIALTAGSVLYVPGGMWFAATASEDSFSLVVHYTPTTFLDVALSALRSRLIGRPSWRGATDALTSKGPRRDARELQLTTLLEELSTVVDSLAVDQILPPPTEAGHRKRRAASEVFDERLPAALQHHHEQAAILGGAYRVVVDGAGTWVVDLNTKPARITRDGEGEVDITIEISSEDFPGLYAEPEAESRRLYTETRLRLWGPDGGKRAIDLVRLLLLGD